MGRVDAWRLLVFVLAFPFDAPTRAEDRPAEPSSKPVLHLRNGGFVPGALSDSKGRSTVRWQPAAFVDPFEFRWNVVNSIHFRSTWELPKLEGAYVVELAGGDTLFASLLALDDREAVLELPRLGRLRLPRSQILRMDRRRAGSELIYLGPNGLMGWHEEATSKLWREDAGQVVSDRPGAVLRGDFGIPERAIVEFQLSWRTKPDFVLALAVNDDELTPRRAFRFEVWESALVVHRETEKEADVASLQEIANGPGQTHLLAYLDQVEGRIVVVSPDGKKLAEMTLPDKDRKAYTGILMANNNGNVRLERLRISRWNGPPASESPDESSLRLADGTVVKGRVVRFDADAKQFVVKGPESDSRVAEEQVASVRLSSPTDQPPRTLRVSTLDGGQLSGEMTRVADGAISLALPGVEQELKIPFAELRSLAVRRHEATPPEDDELMRLLELDDTRLFGRIAELPGKLKESGLAWKPMGSTSASELRRGVSGRIVSNWWETRTTGSANAAPLGGAVILNGELKGVLQVQDGLRVPVRAPVAAPAGVVITNRRPGTPRVVPRLLYLRAGDILPGEVTKIDEEGVWIQSSLSRTSVVPHDKIKAVELRGETGRGLGLSKAKLDRLLTLPRLQKDSPPTHLIGSTTGDYLRGRLIGMNEKTLQVEVRLEVKEVPRDRVARIIWLHPESLKPPEGKAKPADENLDSRVLAICRNGFRLTFAPERVADNTLFGRSDVLGACQVRLRELDQLLIGKVVEQNPLPNAYQQWTLTPASEPNVSLPDQGGSSAARSVERPSVLVGKPAPDFELSLLSGEPFHLADNKGKVVVLDFWATWCGPCLQAMPQVDRVTQEFRDQDVRLIAVNLQETPRQITAMLERQKLNLTVALDREGKVAEKYKANAIPQTVVIDRDGNVVRLFVGSSPRLGDELREALKSVLSGSPKDKPIKE